MIDSNFIKNSKFIAQNVSRETLDELNKYIKPETELYRSLFLLDDSAIEHFRDKGTIRSYRGSYALDKLTFDIDKKKDTGDHLLSRLGYFIDDLTSRDVPDEHIRIWFSGTGFHVEMPDYFGFEPSPDLPAIVKATLHKEFKDIDNVYDKGRLMRVGYSYNMKSKRYKIPLTIQEISEFKYEDIMEKASKQWFRDINKPLYQNYNPLQQYKAKDIKHNLINQLTSPVKWIDIISNIYNDSINPVLTSPEDSTVQGTGIISGQKTLLKANSALNRLDVRRLMVYIRRQTRELAYKYIFEPNKPSVLAAFSSDVSTMLESLKSAGAVDMYKVVIDETTTSSERLGNIFKY